LLGVYLGSEDNLMRPAPDNPRGYWENQQLTDINDEILTRLGGSWHELPAFSANWESAPALADIRQKARIFLQKEFASASFWGWKDPRTSLTLPFWQNLLPRLRFIICLRNPVDVARSLEHRNGFSFEKSDYLWLNYVKSALEHTAGQPRLFLFYEDVMAAWPYELERLKNFLEQSHFAEQLEIRRAIEESIDTELHHHRTSTAESVDDPSVSFYVKALYMLLRGYHPSRAESDSLEPRQGFLDAIDRFSLFALSALNEKKTLIQRVPELEHQVSQLITEKSALLGQSSQLQAALESRDKSLWDMEQRLNRLTTEKSALLGQSSQLQTALETRDKSLWDMEQRLNQRTAENTDLLGQASQLQTALESRDKSLWDMEQRLNQLTAENVDLLGQSSQLQTALETQDKCLLASEIVSREMSETLTRIYASHGWKALWLYYGMRNRMFPLGSMRRKLARLLFHAVQGSRVDLSDEEAAGNASAPSFFQDFNTSALGGREAIAACTIISKNYIAFARTLADSFRKFHPDLPFFVLLVDRIDGCFRPDEEKFHLVGLDELNIPDLQEMCFKYTILDLNTAVKPYFLSYLFDNHNIKHLVFLDPDILITENLSHLFDIIRQHAIVITPHITVPFADDRYPGDLDILQAGAYNLGFIALSDHDISRRFLGWWSEKVYDGALLAHEKGMHNDQRWVDLVPALFDDVYILKHPGYNVAYWNLHSRRIETKSRKVFVNNEPCYFFHFSGLNPADISNVSKHQDRYTIKDIGAASRLLEQYRDLVLVNGHSAAKNWPYAFGQFDHGVKIPDIARRIYYTLGTKRKKFGNPFSAVSPTSFFNWLKEPVDDNWNSGPIVTRLWYELYLIRSDIKAAYPDVLGRDRSAFVSWIINSGRIEHQIDDRLIPESPQNNTHISSNGAQPAIQPKPFGINVAGYFGSEKGVGEAGRAAVRALQASAVPYVLNNVIDSGSVNSDSDSDLSGLSSSDNPYSINLIHVNADQIPNFTADRGVSYFSGHYNIGCWFWELSQFPEEWYLSFSSFHELWAPTSFIQDALSRVAPIPIIKMPLALSPAPELLQGMSRRNFGLSAGNFLFLSIFDFASTLERKNPLGLIQAFNKAFGEKDNVTLVLKVAHSDQYSSESETLKRACATTNVRIMDGIFSRQKLNTLLSFCDCYVSLHRSEGFGFPIAEAMTLGKPVVATAYSGNMDFTTPSNSFLIKYKILEIDRDYGPYRKGCVWAEPDVDHAAEVMRYVYENQSRAESVGQQARQDMVKFYEPRKVGQQIKERLIRLASAGKIRLPDASPYFPCKDR
jgi:glycosyltransferase involved in cell wall biosynthesis